MSLDINQIALHQLIKRDEQNLELVLRDSLLALFSSSNRRGSRMHNVARRSIHGS